MSARNDAKAAITIVLLVGSTACPPSRMAETAAVVTQPGCHNHAHVPERERHGAIREPQLAAVTTSGNLSSAGASFSTAIGNLSAL